MNRPIFGSDHGCLRFSRCYWFHWKGCVQTEFSEQKFPIPLVIGLGSDPDCAPFLYLFDAIRLFLVHIPLSQCQTLHALLLVVVKDMWVLLSVVDDVLYIKYSQQSSGRGGIGNIHQSSASRDRRPESGPDDFSVTRGREPISHPTQVRSHGGSSICQ